MLKVKRGCPDDAGNANADFGNSNGKVGTWQFCEPVS